MTDIQRFVIVAVGAAALLASAMVGNVVAQERPGPALEFIGGWVGFADDGIVSELRRWDLAPKL